MNFFYKIGAFFTTLLLLSGQTIFAQKAKVPAEILTLKESYPDINLKYEYDKNQKDWEIEISIPPSNLVEQKADSDKKSFERKILSRNDKAPAKKKTFYWAGGKLLPKSELGNSKKYCEVFYAYPEATPDPAFMDEAEIQRVREYASDENRKNGLGTPMFFFDAIYSSSRQTEVESHIMEKFQAYFASFAR